MALTTAQNKPKPLAQAAAAPSLQQQAQAQIDPIIAALTAAANARATGAESAINGLTDSYKQQVGGIDYGAPYQNAEGQQAAVDAALRQALSGEGSNLGSGLSSELSALQGSSGASALAQEAAKLGSQGDSAGTTTFASGSANLGNLIANAANAKTYGAKMPGIVDLAGLQGVRQAEGNAQQEISQGTLAAEQNLPSIVHDLAALGLQKQSLKAEQQYRKATLGLDAAKYGAQLKQGNIRLGIEQQNANTSAARAAQTAFDSNRNYSLSLSRLGIEGKRLQLEAIKQEGLLRSGGLSPAEVSRYTSLATSGSMAAWDAGASYRAAIEAITAKGVPVSVAAKALHNAGYKPGVRGTPIPASPAVGNGQGMFAGLGNLFKQAGSGGRPLGSGGSGVNFSAGVETAAGDQIIKLAKSFTGTPYVWGGESPKGFDCSGFAQYLYGKLGVNIPRTTYDQWRAPNSHPVAFNQLHPGDLVFFRGGDARLGSGGQVLPGHVGIYIGNGLMIDAPHQGASVRIEGVQSFGGYMGARRYR